MGSILASQSPITGLGKGYCMSQQLASVSMFLTTICELIEGFEPSAMVVGDNRRLFQSASRFPVYGL
jgi:hypothetical protein